MYSTTAKPDNHHHHHHSGFDRSTWKIAEKPGRATEVLPGERWIVGVVLSERRVQLHRPRHAIQHLGRWQHQ